MCNECKKVGHFAKLCKNVKNNNDERFLNNNYLFTVDSTSEDRPLERFLVNEVLLEMLVGSDAMENVIHVYEYKRLSGVTLDITEDPLWAYGHEQPLNVLGKF